MSDGNTNPFANEEMANDPIAQRIVMKVCAHKDNCLDLEICKRYVGGGVKCGLHMDDLKLNKWRVIMRWILKNHKRERVSEWSWLFYKIVAVLRQGDVCEDAHLIIGTFDSEKEAAHLCAYLKTKFVIFLAAYKQVLKQRQKNTVPGNLGVPWRNRELTWNSFEYVPVQDFSKPWTDAELYKEYELDQDEIDFIESNIKAIEDDDCDVLSGDKEDSHV